MSNANYQPYPAYVESRVEWVGQAPAGWQVQPFFVHASQCKRSNKGMVNDNLLSLSFGRVIRKNIETSEGLLPESFETYQVIEPDDVVFRLTDLQNDKRSLRSALCQERGIITSAYLAAKPSGITARYLAYLMRSYDLTKVLYALGSGLRQSLKYSDMKRLPLLVPSKEEQTQIAKFLDHEAAKIDALIEKQQRLIALLKEKRQAVISHAVTKGLNPDVPMRDSGVEWLGEVPAHWTTKRIKNLTSRIVDGPHFSPKYTDDGYMFISARNIKVSGWSLSDAKFVGEQDFLEFNKRVRPELGDVLLTKGGTTGVARAVDLDFPFQVWVHVAVLKTIRSAVNPFFLAYALNGTACYEQSQIYTRGATNNDLGLTRIANIFLVLPSLEEQEQTAAELDRKCGTVDALIGKAEASSHLLQERRTALICAAVTGKIDVRGWKAPEPEAKVEAEVA